MDPRDLAEKRDGGGVTALPLLNVDPDTGVGLGARVYYYWNGRRDNALFAYTPYLHRVFAQAFLTTNGAQLHALDYDGVYIGRTRFRLHVTLSYERNIAANYYGSGAKSLSPLSFPGGTGSYSTIDEYERATSAIQPDGTTYSRYNKYDLRQGVGRVAIERDLFGGAVRVLGGLISSYAILGDFTGASVVTGDGTRVSEAPTLMHEECARGIVIGCENGWNNLIKLAIAYDTRNFEPDPTTGVFVGLTGELSRQLIGSRYDYQRLTAGVRGFYSPFPTVTRLVLAARAAYSVQTGDVPVFDMGTLAFIDSDQSGLGGIRTLRGFKQDRFLGRVAGVANIEARWTVGAFRVRTQRFSLLLAPFADIGRVFDDVQSWAWSSWKLGRGVALRLGINQATIISADYGVSAEGSGLYVNFGQPF